MANLQSRWLQGMYHAAVQSAVTLREQRETGE